MVSYKQDKKLSRAASAPGLMFYNRGRMATKLHYNKRLWQKHVLAENRRDIPGLLATLVEYPLYILMATGQEYRHGESRFRGERMYFDMYTLLKQMDLGIEAMPHA